MTHPIDYRNKCFAKEVRKYVEIFMYKANAVNLRVNKWLLVRTGFVATFVIYCWLCLDGIENIWIFKTVKTQWNNLINRSWMDGREKSWIFKTVKRQWNNLDHWIMTGWHQQMDLQKMKNLKRQWNILMRDKFYLCSTLLFLFQSPSWGCGYCHGSSWWKGYDERIWITQTVWKDNLLR